MIMRITTNIFTSYELNQNLKEDVNILDLETDSFQRGKKCHTV